MIKKYDTVVVKATGKHAAVIEIEDDEGTKPPIYLVEVVDEEKPEHASLTDVVFWCDHTEIEKINLTAKNP